MRAIWTAAMGVLVISAVACGGRGGRGGGGGGGDGGGGGGGADGGGGGGSVCGAGRTGVSECFTSGGTTCSAGQYCDMSSGFNACEPGCTSDTNCVAGDHCVRAAGAAVGVCASCAPVPLVDAGPPSGLVPACRSAIDQMGVCGLFTPAQVAVGHMVCESELTDAERRLVVECVEAASGDCLRMSSCQFGSRPVDAGTLPGFDAGPPPDTSLTDCFDECDSYAFFDCLAPGAHDACQASCRAATMADREQFVRCGGSTFCDSSCFDYLP